jgi:hypothetical protein
MKLDDLFALALPLSCTGVLIVERAAGPARAFPHVRFWFWAGLAGFLVAGVLGGALPGKRGRDPFFKKGPVPFLPRSADIAPADALRPGTNAPG